MSELTKHGTQKRYRARKHAFVQAYKAARGCCDCGTREPPLDFDHRPGETKLINVAHLTLGWARLKAEIAKCDIRCRACHARRHGKERGGLNPARAT